MERSPSTARIVLCEDEELVAEYCRHVLEDRGHHVQCFPDAESCLSGASGPVNLLLSDLRLPGLDGPALWARFAPEHPGCAVLFMSGYFTELGSGGKLHRQGRLLPKPFSSEQLLRAVEGILAGERWQPD